MTIEEFYDRFDFNADASGSEIGRGGFSVVYKAYDKVRKRFVAIKRSEVGQYSKFDLKREVEVANEIEPHANILRYENMYRFSERLGTNDFAIMKYYPEGNLENVIRKHQLSEADQLAILKGILHGLAHIHQIPIIHRDFKTANILMDKDEKGNWIPLICDFGQSRLIDTENSVINNNSQIALTPKYSAPEQLLDTKSLRTNADLWAFGVIVYQMMKGKMPFTVDDSTGEWGRSEKIRFLILQGEVPNDIATIKEPYQSIVRQCLVVDPEKRVKSANELLILLEKAHISPPKVVTPEISVDKTVVFQNISTSIPKEKVVPKPVLEEVSEPEKKKTSNLVYIIPAILVMCVGAYFLFFRPSSSPSVTPEAVVPDAVLTDSSNVKPKLVVDKIDSDKNKEPKNIPNTKPIPKESRELTAEKSTESFTSQSSSSGTIQVTSNSDCLLSIDGKGYGRLRANQSKKIQLIGIEGSNPYKNYVITLEKDNGEKIVENILVYAGRVNSRQLNFD